MPDLRIRFVAYGLDAPEPVPEHEVWVDVGGRNSGRVFDHHQVGEARSAAEAVWRGRERLQGLAGDEITIVTHIRPDLDGMLASWLVRGIIRSPAPLKTSHGVETLVDAVSRHDHGQLVGPDPRESWPIVVRTALGQAGDDQERLRLGWQLVDQTLAALDAGADLQHAARQVASPNVAEELAAAEAAFEGERARGREFSVTLPRRDGTGTEERPGLWLFDPQSALFKEMARSAGYTVLGVSWRKPTRPSRWRHIVSVPPDADVTLRGYGDRLARAESQRSEGVVEESPWYDGSGHDYTIVDSPVVRISEGSLCGSLLTPSEARQILLDLCSPQGPTHP
jgi:hypothetical protein